jgi:S1-C subfamily serine protease
MNTANRLISCLLAGLCMMSFTAHAQSNDDLKKATVYVEAGRIDDAVAVVKDLQPSGRDQSYDAYLLAGKIALNRGKHAKALEHFERAQSYGENSFSAAIGKAQAMLGLGQLVGAKIQADTARAIDGNSFEPDLIYARAELYTGKRKEAFRRLDDLVRRQPSSDEAIVTKARLSMQAGEPDAARDQLQRFIEKSPSSALVNDVLGDLAQASGSLPQAAQFKQRAADLYSEQGNAFRRDVVLAWLEKYHPQENAEVDTLQGAKNANPRIAFPFPAGVHVTGGSGFVVDSGRKVVTNRHVVEGGKEFAIRTGLGEVIKAKVLSISTTDDLALLELEQALPVERAIRDDAYAKVAPGKAVVVMGFPLWYLLGDNAPSLTNGIISKESGLKDDPSSFQLTAKVNKGSSGGPVFDLSGNVVGITFGKLDTKRIQEEQGFLPEDVNFAIKAERLPRDANTHIGMRPPPEKELTIEQLYQQMLSKVVMVATYR